MLFPAPFLILIYLTGLMLVSFSIIYFALNGKRNSLLYSFLVFQSLIFIWIFHDIIFVIRSYYPPDDPMAVVLFSIFFTLEAAIATLSGPSWLAFSLFYTDAKITRKRWAMILLWMPALIFFVVFRFGLSDVYALLLQVVYSYGYILIGVGLLIAYAVRNIGTMKRQSLLLIAAVLIPLALNLQQNYHLHILHRSYNVYGIDTTPLGFLLTIFIFAFATFQYRFLNITPYAFSELFDSVAQGIVVVDLQNHIMNANASIKSLFPGVIIDGGKFPELLRYFGPAFQESARAEESLRALEDRSVMEFEGEIALLIREPIIFHVTIQPYSRGRRSNVLGRIITLNDITESRLIQSELERTNKILSQTNQDLAEANAQLQRQSELKQEVAVLQERNRFAREAHDTVGHTFTLLITLLQVCEITIQKDIARTKEKLTQAITVTRDGLQELRKSISGLRKSSIDRDTFGETMWNLKRTFEASGVGVKLTLDGCEESVSEPWMHPVYRICQEGLTNALRHGKAHNVDLVVRKTDQAIKVFIADDGGGCAEIHKGNGLLNMEQRVAALGGWIKYGSGSERGFTVFLEIPSGTTGTPKTVSPVSEGNV